MADLDRLDALARAYDAEVHKIRRTLQAFGSQMWASLPDYRDEAVEALAQALAPRVVAGQVRTAELTRAYLIECARELGLSTTVPPIDRGAVTGMRGVDPLEVYQRPGRTAWTALSRGKTLDQAVEAGGLRLLQLIGGDLQNAKRVQSRDTMRATGGRYYRRVLSGRENCALCVIASTQRYYVADLMPIHPGCDCSVSPLPADMAMHQVIDEDTLEAAHRVVEERTGASDRGGRLPDYRKVVLQSEHGEYGPVISFKRAIPGPRKDPAAAQAAAPAPPQEPPRRPPAAPPGAGGHDHHRRPRQSLEERYARQRRLKSDLSDLEASQGQPREVLESDEIDFLERFEARGQRARWIRRDRSGGKPTNDFLWLTNGELVCELKSTTAKYGSIRSHIQRAVIKARGHGVTKDVFVIDLGRFRLTDKLRLQLGKYNQRVADGQIRRLFVLSQDGAELTEIDLV